MNLSRKWGYETHHKIHPLLVPSRWSPFVGKYPDPTDQEFDLIFPYLLKYEFEDNDFVEEDDEYWLTLKKKYNCPNLRAICMEFLHVVRESKGYDLTFALNLFDDCFIPVSPHNKVELYKRCQDAALWAIDQINTEAITSGKKYQFLSLDNAVWTKTVYKVKLLTITVKEFDADVMEVDSDDDDTYDYEAKTIRAMVEEYDSEFELLEWKFKVDQSETCPSISHLSLLG